MIRPAFFAFVLLATAAADEPAKTKLKIKLPQKSARVYVDGALASKRGPVTREVTVPAGKKIHEVEATWLTNDYTRFTRTVKVAPKPGGTVEVDLSKPDAKNPDKIEIRYVPTPTDVVARMCKLGKVGKDDVVYDLGCGDGRMVILAVKDFGAKRGVGIDLDPERVLDSMANAKKAGVEKKVEFREGDVLDIKDLKDASVVLLYMGEDVNARLMPIFKKTLKPGSRIVSHRFLMGKWKPEKSERFEAEDGDEYEIHLWTVGK